MQINWRLKSTIFALIDAFRANYLLYALQKNVTRRSRRENLSINPAWEDHREALEANQCTNFVFEFGAGKDLAQNLFLSAFVGKQLVIDLYPMVDWTLVNQSRLRFLDLRSQTPIRNRFDLLEYGIDYAAPCDAADLPLPDRSVDGCVSTNVLEHIPEKQIVRILTELRRVLKIDGVVSAQIDYSDHYAHTDSRISLWNFLNFSDSEWSRHNHACHFQNRLRHHEYRRLFIKCGFQVLQEEPRYSSSPVPRSIASKYENDALEWEATSGYFLLKNSR